MWSLLTKALECFRNKLPDFSNNVQNWESKKQAAVRDMSYKISLNFI